MRDGLPNPVYWLLVALFVLATGATLYWMYLYDRDVMIAEEPLVVGRFDTGASMRLTTSCFAVMALASSQEVSASSLPKALSRVVSGDASGTLGSLLATGPGRDAETAPRPARRAGRRVRGRGL